MRDGGERPGSVSSNQIFAFCSIELPFLVGVISLIIFVEYPGHVIFLYDHISPEFVKPQFEKRVLE